MYSACRQAAPEVDGEHPANNDLLLVSQCGLTAHYKAEIPQLYWFNALLIASMMRVRPSVGGFWLTRRHQRGSTSLRVAWWRGWEIWLVDSAQGRKFRSRT